MDYRKARLIVNKSGGTASKGGVTFRVTLPSNWVRKLKLDEDNRNVKLYFDGKKIIIENNEEEIKMLNKILEDAKVKIEKEMAEMGYIDDTDETDRFIDNLARDYEEEYEEKLDFDDILEMLEDYMKKTYKRKGSSDNGHYSGCYYKYKEGLKKWESLGE